MNFPSLRRFGAAVVFSVLVVTSFAPTGLAADSATEGLHHGSRAKAGDGTMVVYDKVNGVFLVPNHENSFWIDQRFYQYRGGLWLAASVIAGPWELVAAGVVPEVAKSRFGPLKATVTAKLPSGRDAVYEPRLKVYKVAGRKGVFLFDASYYRYDGGIWLGSKTDDGPWAPASQKILPIPLRRAVPVPDAGQTVKLPSGETVVYDAESRVFTLEGKPNTMFFDGSFYENREQKWFASTKGEAGFEAVEDASVPPPVRIKYHRAGGKSGKPKLEKKGSGQGKAGKEGAKAGKPKHDKPDRKAKKAGTAAERKTAKQERQAKKGTTTDTEQDDE